MNAGVQKLAEAALARGIAGARTRFDKNVGHNYKAPSGAVVVLEARTGRVVALASNPTYDPKVFVGGLTKREFSALTSPAKGNPLLSRATQGLFSPGSTFKLVSTSAAVKDGASLGGFYSCPSFVQIGGTRKRNFESETLGSITLHTALVKSCDTVFYQFAVNEWLRDGGSRPVAHPKEPMVQMARGWGFGARTGIDLPSERRGSIIGRAEVRANWEAMKADYCKGAKNPKFPADRRAFDQEKCTDGFRYNAGDAANFAVGQGDVNVTPLQLATAYAALANNGTLYQPRIAKALLSADGSSVRVIPPAVNGRVPIDSGTLAYIRGALAEVTAPGGTAQVAFAGFPRDKVVVAGKTGTAEIKAGVSDTSWFASFAPANNPQYVVVAMVEEAGTGGTTAAPITREIWDGIYGFSGHKPLLPAVPSSALPKVRADGVVVPPGSKVTGVPPHVSPYVAPSPVASTASALAPSQRTSDASAQAALPDADRPRRGAT
jgi:penicillin-binding protein 2